MKSGFATLIGRPNVGKSTLLNMILGTKVSITSPVVQTTRNQVRGVLNRPDADAEKVREFCRAHLGSHKMPTTFRVVNSLPRTAATGKLRRTVAVA